MSATQPISRPDVATRLLAGVSVPDTPVITHAIEYAKEHSEPYLFNHVMRSWLFAVILAQLNHTAHDGEVPAVTTILHVRPRGGYIPSSSTRQWLAQSDGS